MDTKNIQVEVSVKSFAKNFLNLDINEAEATLISEKLKGVALTDINISWIKRKQRGDLSGLFNSVCLF